MAGTSPDVPIRPLTKIVATVGPASADEVTLGRLIDAGVDVFRLNFSHGTRVDHAQTVARVRALAAARGAVIALLQDLQGPKLRVGELVGGEPVRLLPGNSLTIVTEPVEGTAECISTTYDRLSEDVKPGDRMLLDDGAMEVRIEAVQRNAEGRSVVNSRVLVGGLLKPRKGINLPGTAVSVPALTAKDLEDLAFGVSQGVDYIALSFVRAAADVRAAQAEIRRLGGRQPVIAKIEKPQAITRLEEIIRVSDGVMVARGDLGVEMSPEAVPMLQKRIIRLANAAGVPVITATQMLESMIVNPRPTRAEASDVANAILDGTDAVMLSGETAVGAYPVGAVETMARIAREAERGLVTAERRQRTDDGRVTDAHAVAHAARALAGDLAVPAIAVLTATGRTAGLVSRERPGVPIVAFTDRPAVARRLALWRGVLPVVLALPKSTDAALTAVEQGMLDRGVAQPGERIVVVGSAPRRARGRTPFVQVHRLPDS